MNFEINATLCLLIHKSYYESDISIINFLISLKKLFLNKKTWQYSRKFLILISHNFVIKL